ncbi:MAG: hypothetical protein PHC61_02720 [Chitinivibrionales bacterium]|nr:hypothetical protein [Chitinivibrionales bacterium]
MKSVLCPVYFKPGMDPEFSKHLALVKSLLSDEAEVLAPVALGSKIPAAAEALVFPQLTGAAFSALSALKKIALPVLVMTSDFGTVHIWDWEIVTFMRSLGLTVFAPYDLSQAQQICRALALRREMKQVKFLVYQDKPGIGGQQPDIFKRFWWWEDRAAELIREKFGIRIVKKSFKALGAAAKKIGDAQARAALKNRLLPVRGLGNKPVAAALKLYLAVRRDLDEDRSIQGAGINCLNESEYADTTPCLAWDLLYRERRLIGACEADTLSLMTMFMLERSFNAPVMMSNLYPFLLGGAACKHEKIDAFPDVPEPENHLLMVHCGFFGLAPRSLCTAWALRPKVLAIVNDNAHAVDARIRPGPVTLAKLHPELLSIQAIAGELEGYVQYKGSDCRNGGLLKVKDGPALMKAFYSHHYCLLAGKRAAEIENVARVMDVAAQVL